RRGDPSGTPKPKPDVPAARALAVGRGPERARAGGLPLAELVRTPRLGETVVELHDVTDGHGDGPPLFEHVDLLLGPGERLGVVGVNGSGKSTLLDLIAGRRQPRSGRAVRGSPAR